jgi:cell division initiation protein
VSVTPLDLPTQQFRMALRGFDRREVSDFVASLATRYDEALREADRLRDDLGRAQALVEEHREQERNLRATLMTAQKLADEIRLTAEQESQRIIGDAQARAAALLQGTAPRSEALEREIAALCARREQAAAAMAATVATLRATLAEVRRP